MIGVGLGVGGLLGSYASASVGLTTPTLGASSFDEDTTASDNLTYTLSHTTVTGDFIMGISCRSQGTPTPVLDDLTLSGTGAPVVLGTASVDGADRMLAGAGYVRGAEITTHTITFEMSNGNSRDFVVFAVDVVDMAASGTPVIGFTPYTRVASGTDIGGSYTPDNDANRIIFWGAIGNGTALPLTPTGITLIDSRNTDTGGDLFDHVAGLGDAVAASTAARTLEIDGDASSTYAAACAFELVAAS